MYRVSQGTHPTVWDPAKGHLRLATVVTWRYVQHKVYTSNIASVIFRV